VTIWLWIVIIVLGDVRAQRAQPPVDDSSDMGIVIKDRQVQLVELVGVISLT